MENLEFLPFGTKVTVDDYPYGFRKRTSITYWIEFKKDHGFRFCSQTINPDTGKLNKPKCSTYVEYGCLTRDENGHIKWAGFSWYDEHSTPRFLKAVSQDTGLGLFELEDLVMNMVVHLGADGKASVMYCGADEEKVIEVIDPLMKELVSLLPFRKGGKYTKSVIPIRVYTADEIRAKIGAIDIGSIFSGLRELHVEGYNPFKVTTSNPH